MDVKKLPQALTPAQLAPPAGLPFSCLNQCVPACCRPRCALEVLDELLAHPAILGEDADCLLDLRQLLQSRREAESALRLFCELRRRLERHYYLLFYRLRRWLENHIVAEIQADPALPPTRIPLRLASYCVEPLRRQCLCSALSQGIPLPSPKLTFTFVPIVEPTR
ncbi:MAG TPA: hypothetical protein VNT26_07100 [Candidatus Sulfotelmatobacter sp.]|nr:hypothetical protein [Candidatus Sulfotelmatobacter sp.]